MVAIDDILVVLYITNMCGKVCERLQEKCIETIVKSDVDIVTLDKALPHHIMKQVLDFRLELGLDKPENIGFPDKQVKKIHQALDSDDVELVRMLLKECHTNLDEAYALHYVVAYCDPKTTTELLDLGLADVIRRNSRGYTVLHVTTMTKEPKIIVSLLIEDAWLSDFTLDCRKALQISKRLTRATDYYISTEEGKASPNDRFCIEAISENLNLHCFIFRLAKLLFPTEAKVAMDNAQVDSTSEFTLASINSNKLNGAQRTTVDLNKAPFRIKEDHLNRLKALSRTGSDALHQHFLFSY
ncbi:hypothetical protein REPUB_Repub08aG0091800 [Reevesia pubescens]